MKYGNFPKFCLYVCLFLVALIVFQLLLVAAVDLIFIEKIVIRGHHTPATTLTPQESAKLMLLYHFSPNAGLIYAEPLEPEYSFTIYYRFDTSIFVMRGPTGCMNVYPTILGKKPSDYADHHIRADALMTYVQELCTKYAP